MKVIDVQKAIEMARADESLEGWAIKDLAETQVKAVDALLLADHGIVIPEQNILYRDEDVAYDLEFDDYEWTQLPAGTSLEDLGELAKVEEPSPGQPTLKMELEVEDERALEWVNENYSSIKNIVTSLIKELYSSRSIMEK
ncbi:hypothetical protein [Lewinella sp. W8]|uniref:hypothetical protein n=1 Tax=Lewinella sp. W8 TaxID=2528208 RepID=UPI0010682F22|nr:hypothetical protein [Lewinella sp. W8]MTB50682.1 hypothetical protein [Lewinella sp. W8]